MILLCYDGSDTAKHAIAARPRVARRRRARRWSTCGSRRPAFSSPTPSAASRAGARPCREVEVVLRERAGRLLAEGVSLAGDAGFKATARLEESTGSPWRTIIDVADELDALADRARHPRSRACVGGARQRLDRRHAPREAAAAARSRGRPTAERAQRRGLPGAVVEARGRGRGCRPRAAARQRRALPRAGCRCSQPPPGRRAPSGCGRRRPRSRASDRGVALGAGEAADPGDVASSSMISGRGVPLARDGERAATVGVDVRDHRPGAVSPPKPPAPTTAARNPPSRRPADRRRRGSRRPPPPRRTRTATPAGDCRRDAGRASANRRRAAPVIRPSAAAC